MRIHRVGMASSRKLSPYHNWTREELISRLHQLESDQQESIPEPSPSSFNQRRKIALKFSYSGREYGGLAFQKDYTPLPTVEGVLFDALAKTRLIDPSKGFEGCQWERCGRTDRGVSAAGQVISLWVRSAIGDPNTEHDHDEPQANEADFTNDANEEELLDLPPMADLGFPSLSYERSTLSKSPNNTEVPYIKMLNRVLPQTVRIICWSPISETFSARHSCRSRHYKYFFPASPDLDISRMRDAAARLVGTHDFPNLCTIDGSKQIENHSRRILSADISLVDPSQSDAQDGAMHVLDLVGTAFLYNQVRSIMAVLFLVGSGLEQPYVISSLLNVDPCNPLPPYRPGEPIQVVDRKPIYRIADALPLVLWNCDYGEDELHWHTDDTFPKSAAEDTETEIMTTNVRHQALSLYNRSRVRATLDGHFLRAAALHYSMPYNPLPLSHHPSLSPLPPKTVLNVPLGGGEYERIAKYKPLLSRERGETANVINERWRLGKGRARQERRLAKQKPPTGENSILLNK